MIERVFNATLLVVYSALLFGETATLAIAAAVVACAGVADILAGRLDV